MQRFPFIAFTLVMVTATAHAHDEALINKVKTAWHAQDGETVEQIITKASKVAQFVPKGWEVDKTGDGQEVVTFSWARHSADKPGDEYSIFWEVAADGTMTLGPPYAKPMELGWQAFALSLIDSEIVDDDGKPNLRFLHDLSNLNFVITAQGKLGDLLRQGKCVITSDPVHVSYAPPDSETPANGDYWHVQLQVDCDRPGPTYFTRGGVVLFDKPAKADWHPASMFARRIASYSPGAWFDRADPKEQEVFDIGRKALERAGVPTQGLQSPFPR